MAETVYTLFINRISIVRHWLLNKCRFRHYLPIEGQHPTQPTPLQYSNE